MGARFAAALPCVVLTGCSFFARAPMNDYTVSDGPPSCAPTVPMILDVAVAAAAIGGVIVSADANCTGGTCNRGFAATALVATVVGVPAFLGGIVGGVKRHYCNRATRLYDAVLDDLEQAVANETLAEVLVDEDRLVVDHPAGATACDDGTFGRYLDRSRERFMAHGIDVVECAVAGETRWNRRLAL